jgi:hypothetical protein
MKVPLAALGLGAQTASTNLLRLMIRFPEPVRSNQQDLTDILGRLGVSGLKDPDQPREGIHLFEQLQDGKTYLPRGRVASKTVQVAQKNLVHGAEDTACSALKLALEQQIDQPVQVTAWLSLLNWLLVCRLRLTLLCLPLKRVLVSVLCCE